MHTLDNEQLKRPIQDFRLVTARLEDGTVIEGEVLVEDVDNLRQALEAVYNGQVTDPRTGKAFPQLSTITVTKPLGFIRSWRTSPTLVLNDPNTARVLCLYKKGEKDEQGEDDEKCVWSSPEYQRRLAEESPPLTEEESKDPQTRCGRA